MYIYIYICMYVCIYIYIYIYKYVLAERGIPTGSYAERKAMIQWTPLNKVVNE